MLPLLAFAFLAGVLTILGPCTLPVVPLVVGASAAGGQRRTIGLVIGFGLVFVGATVLFASVLAAAGLTTDRLRVASAVVLGLVGISLAASSIGAWSERRLAPVGGLGTQLAGRRPNDGFAGGLVLGAAIGLIWSPCVGPIMAAVIATSVVNGPGPEAVAIALAYVAGAALPIALIAGFGRRLGEALGGAGRAVAWRRGLGVAMVLAAVLVVSGQDLAIETAVASALPAGWSSALTAVEQQPGIGQELDMLGSDRTATATAAAPNAGAPDAGPANTGGGGTPATGLLPPPIAQNLPAHRALDDLGPAPELAGITAWINSPPVTLASLRGKVVLVEFWTFGCINCIHVQPYVKAWADRYTSAGLVVIGVHTPELSYERDLDNVKAAVASADIRFPVAFDPDFATWNAFHNRYWPAFFFIDRAGNVRHSSFGEGDYEGSEQVIRELLGEPG